MEENKPRVGHCGGNCYTCNKEPYALAYDRDGYASEWCHCNFFNYYEGSGEQPFKRLIVESQVFKPRNTVTKKQKRVYTIEFNDSKFRDKANKEE